MILSLITSEIEYFFKCLLAIHVSPSRTAPWEYVLIQSYFCMWLSPLNLWDDHFWLFHSGWAQVWHTTGCSTCQLSITVTWYSEFLNRIIWQSERGRHQIHLLSTVSKQPWAKGSSILPLCLWELDNYLKAVMHFFFITASLWWLLKFSLSQRKNCFHIWDYINTLVLNGTTVSSSTNIYKQPLCARHKKGMCVGEGGTGMCAKYKTHSFSARTWAFSWGGR